MAKLKDLVKENFSLVGGVVSTPAINTGYSSLSKIVKEKYGAIVGACEKQFSRNSVEGFLEGLGGISERESLGERLGT